jgi:hypothetical protein
MDRVLEVRRKYSLLGGYLNEFTRRFWTAAEAISLGHGVAEATGISRRTIEPDQKRTASCPKEAQA